LEQKSNGRPRGMPGAVFMLTSTCQRLALALAFVVFGTLVVRYANRIAPHISDLASGWSQAGLFPKLDPVGADFHAGVYFPGSLLVSGKDPYVGSGPWYPPFSALFLLPYQIFDVAQAYSIHVVVVVLLTIASVWISIRIAGLALSTGAPSPEAGEPGTSIPLFLSLTFLTLSSYGFLFSSGRRAALAQIVCACGLLILISVSYTVVPPVLGNKYPFILGAQLLLVWSLMTVPHAGSGHGLEAQA
jgi:hypothetical protein